MTKLSRSKIDLFVECPRCFWLDVGHGIKRPPPAPYTINNAIDYLLKQEFDIYREKQEPHPVMAENHIDAIPFASPNLDKWRHNFTGVRVEHKPTDFLVFGAVDDVWVNPAGALMVVDYKATGANQHNIYPSYKRQLEIYQWLLRGNGHEVLPMGYFVFARVNKGGGFSKNGEGALTGMLPFDIFVESQVGDASWMEETLASARRTLDSKEVPDAGEECIYCAYRRNAKEI